MVENLEKRSAAAIGRLIAKGGLDPVEVAEFFLDRIERDRANPSFILVDPRAGAQGSGGKPEASPRGTPGRTARWRARRVEGSRRHGGRAHHRRVGALCRVAAEREGRADRRKPVRGRPRGAGENQSLGVRFFGSWAQSAFRNSEKSPRRRNASDCWRFVFGLSGCGCGRPCALRNRQRHRRLDPGAGELLRNRRVQDERGADRQARRISALTHPRYDRSAGAHCRRLRADRHGFARPVGRSCAPPRSQRRRIRRARQDWNRRSRRLQSRPISKPP